MQRKPPHRHEREMAETVKHTVIAHVTMTMLGAVVLVINQLQDSNVCILVAVDIV